MPRRPRVELERELAHLVALNEVFASVLVPPELRAAAGANLAEEAERLRSQGIALSDIIEGMRQARNDSLEMSLEASPDARADLAKALAAAGLEPLSRLLAQRVGHVRKLLPKGRVETETEYYLLKEVVTTQDSPHLGPGDRIRAQEMLEDFERQAGK